MSSEDFLESTQEITGRAIGGGAVVGAGSSDSAILIVIGGARVGHRVVLGAEPFTIGRGTNASLQLDGDALSRLHARIERKDGVFVLEDLGSTNGSFINYARVTKKPLKDGDQIQLGHVLFKFLVGSNIEAAYHEEFRRLVRQDALTSALNRVTFDEELRLNFSRSERAQSPLSLISFDLDHFKQVNDKFGHTAGDLVLSRVGERVLSELEGSAMFGRLGGEEFGVIAPVDIATARQLAEQLRQRIEALEIEYDGKKIPVSASFGVAERRGSAVAEMIASADRCLYEAKRLGRNRVVVA